MFKKLLALFIPTKAKKTRDPTALKREKDQMEEVPIPLDPIPHGTLPAMTDPIWLLLMKRQISLETNNYALQMLLSWAWKNPQAEWSEAELTNKIKVVHLFFKKHQHHLKNELQQLVDSKQASRA